MAYRTHHLASVDSLEPRRHLANDFAVLEGSTLLVYGTSRNDVADLIEKRGTLRVHMNDPAVVLMFPSSSVTLAIIQLGQGDDTFVMGAQMTLPVKLLGGDGDDKLASALGNDRLEGGNGNDTLIASAGDDRLYGDVGADLLFGGAGRDYLYGGDGTDTDYHHDRRDRIQFSVELLQ